MDEQTCRHYLRDLGPILLHEARKAKAAMAKASNDEFLRGYATAYYDAISVLLSQARVFDIEPSELALTDVDPISELASP